MILRQLYKLHYKIKRRENLTCAIYQPLVETIYGNIGAFGLTSLIAAALAMVTLCRGATPEIVVLNGVLGAATLLQGLLFLNYNYKARRQPEKQRLKSRAVFILDMRYAIVGIAHAVSLGTLAAVAVQDDYDVFMLLTSMIVIIGYAAVIVSRDAARPHTVCLEFTAASAPLAWTLANSPATGMQFIGLMVVLFMVAMGTASNTLYQSLHKTLISESANIHLAAENLQQKELIDKALNHIPSGLLMTNADGKVLVVNQRLGEILKISIQHLVGRSREHALTHISNGCHNEAIIRLLTGVEARHSGEPQMAPLEGIQIFADRERNRVFEFNQKATDNGGSILIITDVTEKHAAETAMRQLAHFDTLTGLNNRFSMRERIVASLNAMTPGHKPVMIFIDLDGFKAVNDNYGHDYGDKLLVLVADRLRTKTRQSDIIARLGGDEFVHYHTTTAGPEQLEGFAMHLIDAISEPYEIDGKCIKIGASVGIATADPDTCDCDRMIKMADTAMYKSKTTGKGKVTWFDPNDAEVKIHLPAKTLNLPKERELFAAEAI